MTSPENAAGPFSGRWGSLLVPALVVLAIILILVRIQSRTEASAANLVNLLPIGFAFAAGMVASVNPCGFLLLPTYISYQLGTSEDGFYESLPARRLGRALVLGLVATAGFVTVFAVIGSLIAAGGQWLIAVFPYAGVAIGAAMIGLGIWLLVGDGHLGILAASRLSVSRERNLANVFTFGLVYALGSLSCTLPIFLVAVGSGLAREGLAASFGPFVSYALGMGVILVAVTIGSALFRDAVARSLRGLIPYVNRASVMFLIGAGGYLIYYWVFFADAIL